MKKLIIAILIILLVAAIYLYHKINCSNEVISTDTFYATIEKITKYNGNYTLLVKGIELNDINSRGEFDFTIKDTTELLWRGTKIQISDLKVGQNISITYDGIILERYPAGIPNVLKVKLLDDEI